jgi:hypothetical protein
MVGEPKFLSKYLLRLPKPMFSIPYGNGEKVPTGIINTSECGMLRW